MSSKRRWLAKVTSFAFPRTFSTGPLPATDDLDALREAGRRHHHVCFTAEITAGGGKSVVGREVEIQLPDDDAEKLARQILRLIEWRKQTNPGLKEDQVT